MITAACQMSDSLVRSVARCVLSVIVLRVPRINHTPRASRVRRRMRTSRSSIAEPHLVSPLWGVIS